LDFTISIQQNLCEIKDLTLVQKMPADAVAAPCTAKIRKKQIARILPTFAAAKSPGHKSLWPGQIMRRLAGAAEGRWLEVRGPRL